MKKMSIPLSLVPLYNANVMVKYQLQNSRNANNHRAFKALPKRHVQRCFAFPRDEHLSSRGCGSKCPHPNTSNSKTFTEPPNKPEPVLEKVKKEEEKTRLRQRQQCRFPEGICKKVKRHNLSATPISLCSTVSSKNRIMTTASG